MTGVAEHLLSAKTIAAVERPARSDPHLAAGQWDRHPPLFDTRPRLWICGPASRRLTRLAARLPSQI
jgi:hypothetical protein